MARIVVLGAGSWGTALAVQLARKGHKVALWTRRLEQARAMERERENKQYLPGVLFPPGLQVGTRAEAVLPDCELVVYAVPSHAFRGVLADTWGQVPPGALLVNVAKGIEVDTLCRLSEVFLQETGEGNLRRYVALSGPSHAEEVGLNLPTTVVAASPHLPAAQYVQEIFITTTFRVYTNRDIVGVELGGALKNTIALGTGIAAGYGFGDNTRAALMTRGLAEIIRLGMKMGANPLTFGGLAGVGDLIVTCTSEHSRNRRAGLEIGRGKSLPEALQAVQMVVEGVRTTKAAYQLSQKYDVEMPITAQTYQVLFAGLSPGEAVKNLMEREGINELVEEPDHGIIEAAYNRIR